MSTCRARSTAPRPRGRDQSQRFQVIFAFRDCLPDRDSLGTHGQSMGRVLDVGARIDPAAGSPNSRAHAKPRVGGVGALSHL